MVTLILETKCSRGKNMHIQTFKTHFQESSGNAEIPPTPKNYVHPHNTKKNLPKKTSLKQHFTTHNKVNNLNVLP